jgi:GT2 family glycosyltransferase
MKKVVAVIVTFNRLNKLKRCWGAISGQKIHGAVIVNNHSSDGTKDWLNSLNDSRLKCVHLKENIGGAGGFQKGCEVALAYHYDAEWYLLFDDDSYSDKNLIEKFNLINSSKFDIITSVVLDKNGAIPKINRPMIRAPSNILELFFYKVFSEKYVVKEYRNLKKPKLISASSFVGLFVSRKTLKENLKNIRAEFFIYCDDVYFTYSCFLLGLKNGYCKDLIFFHDSGHKKENSCSKLYFMTRNQIELFRKFHKSFIFYYPEILLIYKLKSIFKFKKKKWFLYTLGCGVIDGIKRDFSKNDKWKSIDC